MPAAPEPRGRLFRKYVVFFVALVTGALLTSSLLESYFSYQEEKAALVNIQREKATAAASTIEQFIKEVERQIGWTTQSPLGPKTAVVDQRRFDYLRLLRQAPAVTEISYVDPSGKEQLRVSRLAMDVVASEADFSRDPKFLEAKTGKLYFSPVYFRKESEPYMTVSMAGGGGDAGVTVAEVNLKFIWEVISQIRFGKAGHAYAIDARGSLIAHPDISLVLKKTDLTVLPQVRAARAGAPKPGEARDDPTLARDLQGKQVLTAYAGIAPLGWFVFLEQPLGEALAPLYSSILRTGLLLILGLTIAVVASLILARKMVTPIRALQAGAARIGAGAMDHRIDVHTGDELEALAGEFNKMTAQLQESYANLEQKVEIRTWELTEALEQQTATSEILRVISSSPSDLRPVFVAILANVTRLCEADIAALFLYDGEVLTTAAEHNTTPEFAEHLRHSRPRPSHETTTRLAALERRTIHVPDLLSDPAFSPRPLELYQKENVRTVLSVPMLRESALVGVITTWRREVRPFTDKQIDLIRTFVDQAVIAIENVRLFQELQARTRELARSVEELKALGEVGQAVSSTLDLQQVLTTIVSRADQLSGTDGGGLYEYDEQTDMLHLRATHRLDDELVAALRVNPLAIGEGAVGRAAQIRQPFQIPDTTAEGAYRGRLREAMMRSGLRALLAVPLLREDRILGGLVVGRKTPGEFPPQVVDLLRTFATQSALAIQNASLFREIDEKGRQLEIASKHKSQFLANMSHELRTPLNAILGYTELIVDSIYGEVPEKIREVLDRVQANGRHLLGLINDVLDLSKIEAGQLTLALNDYSMTDVVQTVFSAVESLATEKNLALKISLPPDLAPARGDDRRISQVLLNLVGNAIKFTEAGEVHMQVKMSDGTFVVSVSDTGPGIPESDHEKIFEEFQQVDNSSTRKKGGTGLGLAIARRIIRMHGGRIWVESRPGKGSTFTFTVPVRVERQAEAT